MKKNSLSELFSGAFFSLAILLMVVFFSSFASALEFDNSIRYEDNDLKVTLENVWGLPVFGSDLGSVTLKSHSSVNEIKKVGYGSEQVVMWYDFDFKELYTNGLGKVYFYNMSDGGSNIKKDYSFVYWAVENHSRDVYGEGKCLDSLKDSICDLVIVGQEYYTWEGWRPYNSIDIPKGSVRIGLKTYVGKNDYVDGVWSIAGEMITKHASWNSTYEVGLEAAYDFEQNLNDSTPNARHFTLNSGTPLYATDYAIDGYALLTNQIGASVPEYLNYNDEKTISFWANFSNFAAYPPIISTRDGSSGWWIEMRNTGALEYDNIGGLSVYSTSTVTTGTLHHFVVRHDGLNNVTLFIDGVETGKTSSSSGGTDSNDDVIDLAAQTTTKAANFVIDALYLWNRSLSNTEISDLYNGGTGIFYGDSPATTPPSVVLISPENNSKYNSNPINIIANVTDTSVSYVELYINGTLNNTNSSGYNGTYQYNYNFEDGSYSWYISANDSDSQETNSSVYYFEIDTISPTINLISPLNKTYIDGLVLSTIKNIEINYSANDLHINNCLWSINESLNNSINCSENTSINVPYGTYEITVYANDTFGNEAEDSNVARFDYIALINNVSYPNSSLELTSGDFTFNFTYTPTDWSSTTVILNYDDTNYTSTNYSGTTTRYYTETLSIPSVTEETINQFYWILRLTNATGTYVYYSPTFNHTILNIQLLNCSVAPYVIFNLTLKDEESGNNILGTIETNIELYSQDSPDDIISFSYNASNTSNFGICWNNSLVNQSLIVNGKWKYYSPGRNIEYYNIRNYVANETTLNQSVSLYDLNSTVAEIFQIRYKGENFLPVDNALIVVSREFVSEGGFKTVEIPITDTDGKTTASLVKDTAVYNFYIYKEGELLATFQNVIPVCENELTGECNINLNAASSSIGIDDFSKTDDMNYITSYDDATREITLTYSTISGSSATINATTILFDGYGNDTICNEGVTSSSGSLTCSIPESYINKTVIFKITKDGSNVNTYYISLKPNASDFFGYSGYFLAFIMIVMIPFMFITSTIGVVIGLMIGVILTGLLLLSSGGTIGVISLVTGYFVVACAILIYKLNTTERR